MPIRGGVLLGAMLYSVAGCSSALAPKRDPGAPVQTDTTSYVLRKDWVGWRTEIRITWRNPGADTLYIVNCRGQTGLWLQRRDGSQWRDFWTPGMELCLGDPIRIPPGSAFSDTVRIWGAEPGHSVAPAFPTKEVEGSFRLLWTDVVYHYTGHGPIFGVPVPIAYRHSNSFRLAQAK